MPKTSVQLPGLRVFFYSGEHDPRHVHVTNGQSTVVFEFEEPTGPLRLRTNHGFPRHEVNRIGRLLSPHVAVLWEDWNEHFGFEDEEDGDA